MASMTRYATQDPNHGVGQKASMMLASAISGLDGLPLARRLVAGYASRSGISVDSRS